MSRDLVLRYLDVRRSPLDRLGDGAALHAGLLASAPSFLAGVACDGAADLSHRREALARLLGEPSSSALLAELRSRLGALPGAEALAVLEVIVRRRVNCHRAVRLGLFVLLNHAGLVELAATRRHRTARLLRHLLGEKVWSSVRTALRPGGNGHGAAVLDRFVWAHVAAENRDAVREALAVLAGTPVEPGAELLRKRLAARANLDDGQGLPRETLFGLRGTFHQTQPASKVRFLAPPREARAADGALTAALKEAWTNGAAEGPALDLPAEPAVTGRLAVVLDLSGSMASSGERSYHPAALGLAIARRLQARVSDVSLHQVGGSADLAEGFAAPQGETDLAAGLLDAARTGPEAILLITDGYENARAGDAAGVATGLRRLWPETVLFQVVPRFAPTENLADRRLADTVPLVPVDHENDVGELLARVVLAHAGPTLTAGDLAELSRLLFTR
jgi:hypothetical protein